MISKVMDTEEVQLWRGDCREVMAALPDNSVDSIVTDPPYELGFMGKGWDSSGIAFDPEVWAQAFRVLKPGGHLLAFGGTRTWHRVAVAIEDAGFEIRDSIAWLYGQGFPKSMDVAKAIASGTGRPEDIRRLSMGAEYKPSGRGRVNYDNGGGSQMNGSTEPVELTAEAEQWEGWGTALKPAHEPIVFARKPLDGTVAHNVLSHGTGALNIDASRIATADKLGGGSQAAGRQMSGGWHRPWMDDVAATEASAERSRAQVAKAETIGRHPANVIFDESQADALDEQSGVLTSGLMKARTAREPRKGGTIYSADQRNITAADTYADSGGASRFFYVAKAGRDERPVVDGDEHSTVKPLTLMRYLVKLVTPPGGTVLEPFAGSGTTLEAAVLEGFLVIGAELDDDGKHIPLILKRLAKPLTPAMF